MKKAVLLMLCLVLFVFAGCSNNDADPSLENEQQQEEITQGELIWVGTICDAAVVNVRIEPDANSRIVDSVLRGEMFEIQNYNENDEWHNILCRGDSAYVSGKYMYVMEWEENAPIKIGTVYGSDEVICIHSRADLNSSVVLGSLKGEKYLVLPNKADEDWYVVGFPGGSGYIPRQYLEVEDTTIRNALS